MSLSSLNFLSFENRTRYRGSSALFALFIALHLVVLFAAIRFFFPYTWEQQLAAGPVAIVLTGLGCNLMFCFGEYLFHRYLLHMETVSHLRRLCVSHLSHHKLTSIRIDDASQTVQSAYAIEDPEHDDSATFPPWALVAFFAFFTPFFAVTAFSFPQFPILIGGYTAIAIAHYLYETIHVAHHQPYETWWKPKIEGGAFGIIWQKLHGFHQAHHANYKCNMNVAGFYGLPVADWVFGTYRKPDPLLVHGATATKASARRLTPEPRWPISALDKAAFKRRRRLSKE